MDMMYIRDMAVDCIIGTRPGERVARQRLVVNIELETDLEPAAASDRLEDALNYSELRSRILEAVGNSSFFLIERFAAEVARVCLGDGRVQAVTVTVDKPSALVDARSAAVRVRRTRPAAG